MKITFLTPPSLDNNPPAERVFGCNYGIYPIPNIFILYPAAVLEEDGHKVVFIDGPIENWDRKKLIKFLEMDDSDIYAIYTVFLSEKTDLQLHNLIRKIKNDMSIIFFGPQPTYRPEHYLKDENTFIIRGEPELTFKELVNELVNGRSLNKIDGISYKVNGKIIHNKPRNIIENLDILPFPARHLVKKDLYYNPKLNKKPFTAMLTSRGCSHRCYYCVPCSNSFVRELEWKKYYHQKPRVTLRSPKNIAEEFEFLKEDGYKSVSILDDQFVWGEKRTVEICNRIKNIGIEWGCLSRADHLNENIVKAMAKANCKYVDIGVESFDQKILDYIKKDMKVETIFKAVKLLKKYGIDTKLNILLGSCPLETKETIEKNIEIAKKLDADVVMFGACTPFPGTEFYEIAKKKGWIVTGDYIPVDPQKKSIISYPHLKNTEIEKLLRKANRKFYLRLDFLTRKAIEKKSFRNIKNGFKALKKKLWR